MLAMRVAMLALLAAVACTSLVHAQETLQDIDNNEVLPENDVFKARFDEGPVTTDAPPSSSSAVDTTPTPTADPSADPAEGPVSSTTPKADPLPPTEAPPRPPSPPSSLGQFLSEIIQFPIAVLRSVGSLLSNTFSSDRRTATPTTTARPFDA